MGMNIGGVIDICFSPGIRQVAEAHKPQECPQAWCKNKNSDHTAAKLVMKHNHHNGSSPHIHAPVNESISQKPSFLFRPTHPSSILQFCADMTYKVNWTLKTNN